MPNIISEEMSVSERCATCPLCKAYPDRQLPECLCPPTSTGTRQQQMHAICSAMEVSLAQYVEKHAEKDTRASSAKSSSYLVYRPKTVGWGNRIQGLCLAFATALVTDRTFLVDWESPIPLRELVGLHPFLTGAGLSVESILALDACVADADDRGGMMTLEETLAQCDLDVTWTSSVVFFSSGENWIDLLLNNPNHRPFAESMWGVGKEGGSSKRQKDLITHVLFNFLIKDLSLPLKKIYDQSPVFVQLKKFKPVISLQIRTGSTNTSFRPFVRSEQLSEFWELGLRLLACNPNSAIFLATDSIHVRDEAEQVFGEKLFYLPGPIVHSGNEQLLDEEGKERTREGLYKVVLDWWRLGDSPLMINSRDSSFGLSAATRTLAVLLTLPRAK